MKYLLYTVFLLATLSLNAQYEKGNWYLNADAGLQTVTSRLGVGDLLGSSFSGGFFLENNLMLGARLELGSLLEDDLTTTHYRIEPFVRYYLPTDRVRRLRYFAEIGAGLLFERNLQVNLRGGIGAEYQLAPGIMATAGLRYNTVGENRPSGLTLDFGVNLLFGDLERTNQKGIGDRKGTFMLDASVGQITLGKLDDVSLVSGAISLNGGYFLTNKLLLEGGVSFSASNVEQTIGREFLSRSNRYSANLGLRYIFNEGKKFQPYLAAGLRYDYVSQYYESEGLSRVLDYNSSGLSADMKAGFLYNFNDRVALDVNMGYNPNISGGSGQSRVSGGVGLKVFLGKH